MKVIDLGSGFSYEWYGWHPDRSIPANAERFQGIPDIERCTLLLHCPHGQGGIHVDRPHVREVFKGHVWQILQEEPLTLDPSIHRLECGCHGYIREGKWVGV